MKHGPYNYSSDRWNYGTASSTKISFKKPPSFFSGQIDGKERGIQVSKSTSKTLKLCIGITIAVLLILLALAVGVYFGFKMIDNALKSSSDFLEDKAFKSLFHVIHGDMFEEELDSQSSNLRWSKASYYQNRIDSLFLTSILKNIYLRSEVIAFDRLLNSSTGLVVHFNLWFHQHKVRLDPGDIYVVMEAELEQRMHEVFEGIEIDLTSLEIIERKSELGTVISTKDSFISILATEAPIAEDELLPRMDVTNLRSLQCVPVASRFCADVTYYNDTAFPNVFGHKTRYEVDEFIFRFDRLLKSSCYQHLKHFLCALLQPPCENNSIVLPCREFCHMFLSRCHAWIPFPLSRFIRCNDLPISSSNGTSHCLSEPDCSAFLRSRGHSDWICDDINDCRDYSDEKQCNRCKPGQFYCGQNSCIQRELQCDNHVDCPNGMDERNCLSLIPGSVSALSTSTSVTSSSGFLVLQDRGDIGKICIDTLNVTVIVGRKFVVLNNIGRTACELLNYKKLKFVRMAQDMETSSLYFHIIDPLSTHVTFMKAPCRSNHVIYIGCSSFVCGQQSVPHWSNLATTSNSTLSIPGREVGPAAWPWHVAVLRNGIHVCDGTLVAEQWVLTSEACFQGQPKSHWVIRTGTSRLLTVSLTEQQRPAFGMSRSPVEGSSLALLRLTEPVNWTAAVRPACLSSRIEITAEGQHCAILAWDTKGQQLQERRVLISKSEDCDLDQHLSNHAVCAVNLNQENECQAEVKTGGALLCRDGKSWAIAGILNWRVGCGLARRPLLYDKVSSSYRWITQVLQTTF